MATQHSATRTTSPQNPSSPAADTVLLDRAVSLVAEHPDYAPAFAALLQIDVKAPAVPSKGYAAPRRIQPASAAYFRPGYDNLNGLYDLPFVEDVVSEDRRLWVEPDFGEGEDALRQADAFGKRSAAAYVIHLQTGDIHLPLHDLLRDMFGESTHDVCARIAFCGYVSRVLWLFGQEHSPAELAGDVEAVIADDDARATEDDANVTEAR